MSQKEETKFAKYVDSELKKKFGKQVWFENIQQASKRGTADRLCCIRGMFFALELKTGTGSPSKIQLVKLKQVHESGGFGYIVRPDTFDKILNEIDEVTAYLK